jgi:hypothetical protein
LEAGVKLYAWQPQGHGELSFFVCAESQEAALAAVELSLRSVNKYEKNGWGTDYYELRVFEPREVAFNSND